MTELDEYYDEAYYHYESSIRAAVKARMLIVVGTSGATNLPVQVGYQAVKSNSLIIDVNIEANPFSQMAEQNGGYFLQGPSASILPEILNALK